MNTFKDNDIIVLSDRDHILLRSNMYLGAVDKTASEEFILEEGKFVKKEIEYVPGLIKIINEIIDNSIDEAVRTNYEFANKIKIEIDEYSVRVEDNGRGIPVKKAANSEHYMPVLAFCEARAGSNFIDDANRNTIGMNGVGSSITNIYSSYFEVETSDGSNKLKLICKNNMESDEFTIQKCKYKFTNVFFKPDLNRFGLDKIDDVHISIIYQRIAFLSISHPEIKFYLNKKRVFLGNEKSFLSMFSDNYEIINGENWFIGVFPSHSDDFSFFSYVNGLYIKNGGNHVDFAINEIIYRMRDKLIRKYKSIKPADIKNKLSVVVFFNNFKNMKFDSQTKEKLTNSVSEIKDFVNYSSEDWDNFSKKILKNKEITEPVIDLFRIKEEFRKRQELKNVSKQKKRVVSDKYYSAIGDKKYALLTEGDSACGSLMSILGRTGRGYFALRGKPLNTYDISVSRLINNNEIQTIVDVLGLDLTDPDTDMNYEKVIIASDQDADGNHIRSLLLTFFHRFTPRMIKDGRIGYLETPLIVGSQKGKIKKWFFNLNDYNNFLDKNKYNWSYKKGLGSFRKEELQEIIQKENGFENLLVTYEITDDSFKELEIWMKGSEADARKEKLAGKSFNISVV